MIVHQAVLIAMRLGHDSSSGSINFTDRNSNIVK